MAIEKIHDQHSMERTLKEAGSNPVVCAFISYKCGHCRRFMPYLEVRSNGNSQLLCYAVPYSYLPLWDLWKQKNSHTWLCTDHLRKLLCQEMPVVIFRIVDVNTSEDLRMAFGVESVPNIFVYQNGILMQRIFGADKELLVNTLKALGN